MKKKPAKPGNVFEKRCGAECRLESEKLSRLHRVASVICWHRNNCAKMMDMRCTCGLEELMTTVEETAYLSNLDPVEAVEQDVSDDLLARTIRCLMRISRDLDTSISIEADELLVHLSIVQRDRAFAIQKESKR